MNNDIREQVREKYAQAITVKSSCSGSTGCYSDRREATNIIASYDVSTLEVESFLLGKDFNITLAEEGDFSQLHKILIENGLPTAGVDFGKGNYYIASGQELMGVIGAEKYNAAVMLRSLAVKPQFRKTGIATQLLDYALQQLKDMKVTDIYLMTTTAEGYLTKYGFIRIERNKIPTTVLRNSALGDVCSLSSICMHLQL